MTETDRGREGDRERGHVRSSQFILNYDTFNLGSAKDIKKSIAVINEDGP